MPVEDPNPDSKSISHARLRYICEMINRDYLDMAKEFNDFVRRQGKGGESNTAAARERRCRRFENEERTEILKYMNSFLFKAITSVKPSYGDETRDAKTGNVTSVQIRTLDGLISAYDHLYVRLIPSGKRINLIRCWKNDGPSMRVYGKITFNPRVVNETKSSNTSHEGAAEMEDGADGETKQDSAEEKEPEEEVPNDVDALPDYNLFRGLAVTREMAAAYAEDKTEEQIEQEVRPVLDHILHIWCRGNREHYTYVISWMASVVQQPWVKQKVAIVLRSESGAGKGIIVQKLGEIIGRDWYIQVQDQEDIFGRFTHENLEQCLLLFVDEAVWGGNKQLAGRLKKLVTESRHKIEKKYLQAEDVLSFLNLIFASNEQWVVPVLKRERRFFCLQVSDKHAGAQTTQSEQYFKMLSDVPKEAFGRYLYQQDISSFNAAKLPTTELQREQKCREFSVVESWWEECLNDGYLKGEWDQSIQQNAAAAFVSRDPKVENTWPEKIGLEMMYSEYFVPWVNQGDPMRKRHLPSLNLFRTQLKCLIHGVDGKWNQGSGRPRQIKLPHLAACREEWRRQVQDQNWEFSNGSLGQLGQDQQESKSDSIHDSSPDSGQLSMEVDSTVCDPPEGFNSPLGEPSLDNADNAAPS